MRFNLENCKVIYLGELINSVLASSIAEMCKEFKRQPTKMIKRQDSVTSADHGQHKLGSLNALTQLMEGDHESSPILSPINDRINVQMKGNEDNPKGKKAEGWELTKPVQEVMGNKMFPMDQICISIRIGLKENQNILSLISYSIGFWSACVLIT